MHVYDICCANVVLMLYVLFVMTQIDIQGSVFFKNSYNGRQIMYLTHGIYKNKKCICFKPFVTIITHFTFYACLMYLPRKYDSNVVY